MPNYDFQCGKCDKVSTVYIPLRDFREKIMEYCRQCNSTTYQELIVRPPFIEDWGGDGNGRYIDELGKNGMHFPDKASYKRYLKENGLIEWSPKTGMPGSGV